MKNPFKKNNYSKTFNVIDAAKSNLFIVITPYILTLIIFIVATLFFNVNVYQVEEYFLNAVPNLVLKLITYLLIFYVIFMYCNKREINIFEASDFSFKIKFSKSLLIILLSVAIIFLISPFINLLNYFYSLFGYTVDNSAVISSMWHYILYVIALAIAPAIVEEFIYRGIILKGLMRKMNVIGAVLISSLLFTIMHGTLNQTVYQFILGTIFALVTLYSGNLLYAIIFHFINNFTTITVVYISSLLKHDAVLLTYEGILDYALPILLLIMAFVIIYVVLAAVKSSNFSEFKNNLKFKNLKTINKLAINTNNTNIIKEEQDKPLQVNNKFTKQEKSYLIISFLISFIIWIINTLSIIL